jgi:hypothetical protein
MILVNTSFGQGPILQSLGHNTLGDDITHGLHYSRLFVWIYIFCVPQAFLYHVVEFNSWGKTPYIVAVVATPHMGHTHIKNGLGNAMIRCEAFDVLENIVGDFVGDRIAHKGQIDYTCVFAFCLFASRVDDNTKFVQTRHGKCTKSIYKYKISVQLQASEYSLLLAFKRLVYNKLTF